MLEIIILIFLARSMGELAQKKAQPPGRWKLYTVLGWFGSEFFVMFSSMMLFQSIAGAEPPIWVLFIVGPAGGYAGYMLVKQSLERHPDTDRRIEDIGR